MDSTALDGRYPMNGPLRRRIEKLERRPMSNPLHCLPAEVLQRHLDLLLQIYVYGLTGRDASVLRRELEALGPLRLPARGSEPPDEAAIRRMALDTLRAEPERADYRELLAILAAGPVS